MRRFFTLKSTKREDNDIRDLLHKSPGSDVFIKLQNGRGACVRANNETIADMVCDLDAAKVMAICKSVSVPDPAPALVMDKIESDLYFSPRLPGNPLMDILHHRATCEELEDLLAALVSSGPLHYRSYSDINWWLQTLGLHRYSIVPLSRIRGRTIPIKEFTIIDDMVIGCLGYHAIWVKNIDTYTRPEIDIWRYNVKDIAAEDSWEKVTTAIRVQPIHIHGSIMMHTYITDGAIPVPYMISIQPDDRVLISTTSVTELINELLRLLQAMTARYNKLTLVGFMSDLYEIRLLKEYWPSVNIGWRLYQNELIYQDKCIVRIVDVSKFACGLQLEEYCNKWSSDIIERLNSDMIPRSMINKRISAGTGNISKVTQALFSAACAQRSVLRRIFPLSDMLTGKTIGSAFMESAVILGSYHAGDRLFYPAHPDAETFVTGITKMHTIKTRNLYQRVGDSRSINGGITINTKDTFMHIINGSYPLGRPYFTRSCSSERLYIALCAVSMKDSIQIPYIIPCDATDALEFETILTSVDVNYAMFLGGYKIRVIAAIEWENSEQLLKRGFSDISRFAEGDTLAKNIISWLMRSSNILTGYNESGITGLVSAFAASYCRVATHQAIASIDNHLYCAHVIEHDYKSVTIRDQFAKTLLETNPHTALLDMDTLKY